MLNKNTCCLNFSKYLYHFGTFWIYICACRRCWRSCPRTLRQTSRRSWTNRTRPRTLWRSSGSSPTTARSRRRNLACATMPQFKMSTDQLPNQTWFCFLSSSQFHPPPLLSVSLAWLCVGPVNVKHKIMVRVHVIM